MTDFENKRIEDVTAAEDDEIDRAETIDEEKNTDIEPTLVKGLCAFHLISTDENQRVCYYKKYEYPIDQRFVIKDAQDWYRLMLTSLNATENDYHIIINILN